MVLLITLKVNRVCFAYAFPGAFLCAPGLVCLPVTGILAWSDIALVSTLVSYTVSVIKILLELMRVSFMKGVKTSVLSVEIISAVAVGT